MSGIDTIISDLGKDKNAEDLEVELDKIFSTLDSHRLQGMKIIVEPLMPWKRHQDNLRRAAISAFKTIKSKYPGILIPPKPDFLKFTADGVHLTERAGAKFFKLMYQLSIDFFKQKEDAYHSAMETDTESEASEDANEEIEIVGARVPNISVQNTSKPTRKPSPFITKSSGKTAPNPRKRPHTVNLEDDDEDEGNHYSLSHPEFRKLVKDFASFKSKVERRWSLDLLISAGTKEDLDKIENDNNMNKIVFSGVEIHDLWADDLTWAQRLEKIKSALANFIKPNPGGHDGK